MTADWSGTSTITATAEGCDGPVTAASYRNIDSPVTSIITGNETPTAWPLV